MPTRQRLLLCLVTLGPLLALAACTQPVPPLPTPEAVSDSLVAYTDAVRVVSAPGVLGNDSIEEASLIGVNGSESNVGVASQTSQGGSVTVFATGAFNYQPPAAFTGTDTFTYTVGHAEADSTAAVTILVTDPWTALAPLPVPVSRPASAFLDGRFFIVGGETTGGVRLGTVQMFDPVANEWTESLSAMMEPVSNTCAAVIDDDLYVPGGYTGSEGVTALQRFEPGIATWSTIATDPLPAAKYAHGCTAHGEKLYVFGGSAAGTGSTDVWVYDPAGTAGSRWTTTLAPIPQELSYPQALSYGDRIFVTASGSTSALTDLDVVYAYSPATDSWTEYPPLQTPRSAGGAWISGDRLYVGGGGWSTYYDSVEVYDLTQGEAGEWEDFDSMLTGRRTFAAATDPVTGWLYAAAGWQVAYLDVAEVGRPLSGP